MAIYSNVQTKPGLDLKARLLIFAFLTVICKGFIDNARGLTYPEILHTFNIGKDSGSLIFTLFAVAGLAVNLSSKWWLPKFNIATSNRIGLIILLCGALCFGFAGITKHFSIMIIGTILAGAGIGFCSICFNLLTIAAVDKGKERKALSTLHSMYCLAALCTPLVMQFLSYYGFSWPWLFFSIAILALLTIVFSLPAQVEKKPIPVKEKSSLSLNSRLSQGLFFGFYIGCEMLIASRLTLFLTEIHDFSMSQASLYLTIFFVFLLSGRAFLSIVNIKIKSSSILLLSLISTLIAFLIGYFINPFGIVLCGLTMSVFFPSGMTLINETYKKSINSMMATVVTAISISLIISHWLFGQVSSKINTETAMLVPFVLCLLALIMLIKNISNRKVKY